MFLLKLLVLWDWKVVFEIFVVWGVEILVWWDLIIVEFFVIGMVGLLIEFRLVNIIEDWGLVVEGIEVESVWLLIFVFFDVKMLLFLKLIFGFVVFLRYCIS